MCVCVCVCVCVYVQDLLFNPLTDSNLIWCSDYSEPGDKHITRTFSLYLESRATPGISASVYIGRPNSHKYKFQFFTLSFEQM
jgi:hypothetical protein